MGKICVAASALAMVAITAFFIVELPLNQIWSVAKQKISSRSVRKWLIGDIGICLFLCLYGYWIFGIGREYYGFLLVAAYLIAITPKDVQEHIIPDRTTVVFAIIFVLFRISSLELAQIQDMILGAAVGATLMGIPYLIRRESIGLGDVKTVGVCGLMFGAIGTITFLLRAFIAVFIYCAVQLLRKKITMKSEMPFAPFLLFAAVI